VVAEKVNLPPGQTLPWKIKGQEIFLTKCLELGLALRLGHNALKNGSFARNPKRG
jgi:hypothetical protein